MDNATELPGLIPTINALELLLKHKNDTFYKDDEFLQKMYANAKKFVIV